MISNIQLVNILGVIRCVIVAGHQPSVYTVNRSNKSGSPFSWDVESKINY